MTLPQAQHRSAFAPSREKPAWKLVQGGGCTIFCILHGYIIICSALIIRPYSFLRGLFSDGRAGGACSGSGSSGAAKLTLSCCPPRALSTPPPVVFSASPPSKAPRRFPEACPAPRRSPCGQPSCKEENKRNIAIYILFDK